MAITRKNKSVVETNHVSAVRTGNIIAQYPAAADLENGMAVAVDHENKVVRFATATDSDIYLHFSEEQLYEEHLGRNSFYIKGGAYPRVGKLEVGDIFETNALDLSGTYAAKTVVHPGLDGFWATDGAVTNITATIVELVTLPNGESGAKLAITAKA